MTIPVGEEEQLVEIHKKLITASYDFISKIKIQWAMMVRGEETIYGILRLDKKSCSNRLKVEFGQSITFSPLDITDLNRIRRCYNTVKGDELKPEWIIGHPPAEVPITADYFPPNTQER